MCVVSTEIPFVNFASPCCSCRVATWRDCSSIIWSLSSSDVDPTNMDEVLHAITTSATR